MYRILIVEDEPEIIELLRLYLEKDYRIYAAANGAEALALLREQKIDLAILDVMMPGMDGFQLIAKIRESNRLPVLFLSARSQDYDKIWGLGLGADDYMAKPFNPLEIQARVKALLRRTYEFDTASSSPEEEANVVVGELELDRTGCLLYRSGQPVPLTSTEYKIVALLMEQPGKLYTRKKIYESVWDDYYAYDDSTIMVHISNIREKIERDPKQPTYLKTIRGLGYKIEVPKEPPRS